MLLNDYQMMNLSDLKYTTEFTESQKELVQKFNTAFYEAQNRPSHQISDHENILDTFDEKYFTNIEKYEDKDSINGNCFFDFITTKNDEPASNITTPASDSTSCFDYNDFCEKFEQQVAENESRKFTQTASYLSQYGIIIENYEHADNENFVFDNALRIRNPSISTETTSTNLSTEYGSLTGDQNSNGECPTYENATYSDSSPFFVPLPFETKTVQNCDTPELENLELSDIDLNESVSNTSLDLDNLEDISYDYENCQFEYTNDCKVKLPPVNTIVKSNMDFTNRLRNIAPENLRIENQEIKYCNAYGHLIGNKNVNNNVSTISLIDEGDLTDTSCPENNQAVMRQNEALLYDDPMLSSSSLILPRRVRKDTEESEMSTDCEDLYSQLQCKWEKCYQIYESQTSLVRHIEKYHVELKRGEEFTCFWLNCPRKNKPFNARYKLLIHMRVHSGEKPNKCPFNGCNKAFSRLENLKIHQRSHTGERPYLCQISNCTKSFSNSSDRAKHQRTHFDTKPYACQVAGCSKKYTDPSSLRKHVKNHTYEEQVELKKRSSEYKPKDNSCLIANKKNENFNKNRYTSTAVSTKNEKTVISTFYTTLDHSYSNNFLHNQYILSANVKQDLKNKISEKISKEKLLVVS